MPTQDSSYSEPVLEVRDLKVSFTRPRGDPLPVIDKANLVLNRNDSVGIVGESGSGKTMLCRSIIGTLSRHRAIVVSGHIYLEGEDIAQGSEELWRQVRGKRVGYVPQSSLAGLNPVLSIEVQLVGAIRAARPELSKHEAKGEAKRLLDIVQIPRAAEVLGQRPHQLSGGMRQRVMIAGAVAQRPKVLIADEPTTALDVSVQKGILKLLRDVQDEFGMSLIFVSHDLAIIDEICDKLVVMYAGSTVEIGDRSLVRAAPRHPYTRALAASSLEMSGRRERLDAISGDTPVLGEWPTGCRFWPRCPLTLEVGEGHPAEDCQIGERTLRETDGRLTDCLHADQMGEL